MKIYVASSWRNTIQPSVVEALRDAGHEVYDFRNPKDGDNGFHWSDIDPDWQNWNPEQYNKCLSDPIAEAGFKSDMDAMKWADVFVGVQPFGRSASLEMGWAAGNGKHTILLLENGEPELMVKMIDAIFCNIADVIFYLAVLPDGPKAKCIACGCTENDCSQCIAVTGEACWWVAPNKCSRCYDEKGNPKPAESAE